jgi:NCAIR mutase (PurE)-related protein
MNRTEIKTLLHEFKRGKVTADNVIDTFSSNIIQPLDFATVDHHRELRQGFPEVIFCEGKSENQVAEIAKRTVDHGSVLMATRATNKHYAAVRKVIKKARYNHVARVIVANEQLVRMRGRGTILVITAGTSDIPVAEEATETAKLMGNATDRLVDVGVAGIHRIISQSAKLRNASVVIVVAGMEGALPSVVGGLVDVPVIAVPTSVGYGASFNGISALLGMLNSCAAGVTVVNIDNGFGAGFAASLINRKRQEC